MSTTADPRRSTVTLESILRDVKGFCEDCGKGCDDKTVGLRILFMHNEYATERGEIDFFCPHFDLSRLKQNWKKICKAREERTQQECEQMTEEERLFEEALVESMKKNQEILLKALAEYDKTLGGSRSDDLSEEEVKDVKESIEDLKAGRYKFIPGDLSDEEFLKELKEGGDSDESDEKS